MKILASLAVMSVLGLTLPAVAQQTEQENQQQPTGVTPFKTTAEMSEEERKAWERRAIESHRDAHFKGIAERKLQQKKQRK